MLSQTNLLVILVNFAVIMVLKRYGYLPMKPPWRCDGAADCGNCSFKTASCMFSFNHPPPVFTALHLTI